MGLFRFRNKKADFQCLEPGRGIVQRSSSQSLQTRVRQGRGDLGECGVAPSLFRFQNKELIFIGSRLKGVSFNLLTPAALNLRARRVGQHLGRSEDGKGGSALGGRRSAP